MTTTLFPTKHCYTINEFTEAFGIGRTATYAALKSRKLTARKYGARTLILAADAEKFVRGLPRYEPAGGVTP